MQIFYPTKSKFLTLALFLLITNIHAQSRWEYGIGIGINYGDFLVARSSPDVQIAVANEAIVLPYLATRYGYNINDKSKISLNPGISWNGSQSKEVDNESVGLYLELPLVYHRQLMGKLKATGGIQYQFLVSQGFQQGGRNTTTTDLVDSRNFFGVNIGLSYDIGKYAELVVSGHHNLNNLTTFDATDASGTQIGTISSSIRYLRFGIVFRA